MAELIEVLFSHKIGPYNKGQLALIPDGVFLRAVLKGKKGEVVNPPDWSPESADAKKAALETKKEEPVGEGDNKPSRVEEKVSEEPVSYKRARKTSGESSEGSGGSSSEGYGGSSEVVLNSEGDNSGSEAHQDSVE